MESVGGHNATPLNDVRPTASNAFLVVTDDPLGVF
jgi:hypothetical protein